MFNITVTIIFVILVLLIFYHLTSTEGFASIVSNTSPIDKYVGIDKKLILTVKITGKDYVLVARKRNTCKNKDDTVEVNDKNENVKDCMNNVLILMEKPEFDKMIKKNFDTNEDNQKVCEYKHQLKCERRLRNKYNKEHLQSNSEMIPSEEKQEEIDDFILSEFSAKCKMNPFDCPNLNNTNNGEFNLIEVKDNKSNTKKYKLIGRVRHNNTYKTSSMSNMFPYVNDDKVCLDGLIVPDNDVNSSFELLEVPSKDSTDPHFIIKFKTNVLLSKGNYLTDDKGVPVTKDKYVGVCKDSKCGKVYSRLCFYEKEDNPFVLTFVPKIIQ